MNTTDINSVLDNICSKIGTTAQMLVPEMSGYMIARWSICLVFAVVCFIGAGILLSRILKMRRESNRIVKLYLSQKKGEEFVEDGLCAYYVEDDYTLYIFGSITLSIIGFALVCIGVTKIIGWSLSPNAMTVMWIVTALGGN